MKYYKYFEYFSLGFQTWNLNRATVRALELDREEWEGLLVTTHECHTPHYSLAAHCTVRCYPTPRFRITFLPPPNAHTHLMFDHSFAWHLDVGRGSYSLSAKDRQDEVKRLESPPTWSRGLEGTETSRVPLQLRNKIKADLCNRFNSINYQTGRNEEAFLFLLVSAIPQIPKLFYRLLLRFLPQERMLIATRSVLLTNDVWMTSDFSLLVPRIRPFLQPVQSKSCLVIASWSSSS